MKKVYFPENITLIRSILEKSRQQMGDSLGCTPHQIGHYERGTMNVPLSVLFLLEDLTGIPAKRLYYDALNRSDISKEPQNTNAALMKESPQYKSTESDLEERVQRLELAVFGAVIL